MSALRYFPVLSHNKILLLCQLLGQTVVNNTLYQNHWIVDLIVSISSSFASFWKFLTSHDEVDGSNGLLCLAVCNLSFEHSWDTSAEVSHVHRGPFSASLCLFDANVANMINGNDILANFALVLL